MTDNIVDRIKVAEQEAAQMRERAQSSARDLLREVSTEIGEHKEQALQGARVQARADIEQARIAAQKEGEVLLQEKQAQLQGSMDSMQESIGQVAQYVFERMMRG